MQQSTASIRGYSDFFASGFRAVTNRSTVTPEYEVNHKRAASSSFPGGRRRMSLADITQRRLRPSSMYVQNDVSLSFAQEQPSTRSRRSSIVSFSSRLFERITSVSSYADVNSSISSSRKDKENGKNTRWRKVNKFRGVSDLWVSTGGPNTPTAPNGSALHQTIDPFTSSPDARSMFIDLSSSSSDGSPTNTPKRESFLSLSGSSPSRSNRSSIFFTSSTSRRERPTSIHTMPLPSRSRRSSWQYRAPSVSQEKPDSFFLILEEEPALSAVSPIEIGTHGPATIHEQDNEREHDQDEWDAPAKIDWHQFHIDILNDDA